MKLVTDNNSSLFFLKLFIYYSGLILVISGCSNREVFYSGPSKHPMSLTLNHDGSFVFIRANNTEHDVSLPSIVKGFYAKHEDFQNPDIKYVLIPAGAYKMYLPMRLKIDLFGFFSLSSLSSTSSWRSAQQSITE